LNYKSVASLAITEYHENEYTRFYGLYEQGQQTSQSLHQETLEIVVGGRRVGANEYTQTQTIVV
jgi:hypothetical protein